MKDIKDFLYKYLGIISVALICAVFMATAFIEMGRTGKTPGEIISESAITFILGLCIDSLLDIQGIINGERDERVIKTLTLHNDTVVRISPFIERLDDWCAHKNTEALCAQRTKLLAAEGLKYSDCFDSDGVAKPFIPDKEKLKNKYLKRAERRKRRCYRKAVRLKLTPLCAGELTSEGSRGDDPYYMGRSKSQYSSQMRIKDVLSKLCTAGVLGYYGVSLLTDFDPAVLIWRAVQVATLLLMGIIKMFNSQMYMTDEYRGRVIKKIDYLQKFENDLKKEQSNVV